MLYFDQSLTLDAEEMHTNLTQVGIDTGDIPSIKSTVKVFFDHWRKQDWAILLVFCLRSWQQKQSDPLQALKEQLGRFEFITSHQFRFFTYDEIQIMSVEGDNENSKEVRITCRTDSGSEVIRMRLVRVESFGKGNFRELWKIDPESIKAQ